LDNAISNGGFGPFRLDLRELAETAILIDSRGLILGLSAAFEAVSGWLEDDLKGQSLHRITIGDAGPPVDHSSRLSPISALSGVRRFRCRDGGFIERHSIVLPLRSEEAMADVSIIILRGVSENILPANRLRLFQQANDIDESDQGSDDDLERFAQIASHNMQEPLRRIIAYCDLLKQDHVAELSKEAVQIANVIQSGGRHLHLIVNDLLVYIRVRGQLDRSFEPVDMSAVLCHAVEEMKDALEARDARVNACHLPLVWGRAPLFKMVFRHLLSNALKHCGKRSPAIDVTVDDQSDAWRFAVTDKGTGVEARHADRIFDIFQGLSDKDKRDGSGAGLALCRLIIERCGGRIWLDRSFDQGARFMFTLPKSRPDQPAAIATG
jgi:signal transduction histidine kinase